MSLYFVAILVLFMAVASGCNLVLQAGPATPEDAVRQSFTQMGSGQNLQILGKRVQSGRAIVLHTSQVTQGQAASPTIFGYDLVVLETSGWHTRASGTGNSGASIPSRSLICYGTLYGNDQKGAYSIVYGRVHTPDVTTVSVTFDDGAIVEDGTPDGIFAAMLPRGNAPTQIRVLDGSGKKLNEENLSPPQAVYGQSRGPGSTGGGGSGIVCVP